MGELLDLINLELSDDLSTGSIFEDSVFHLNVMLDDVCIGSIEGSAGEEEFIHIELLHIDDEYRRCGYGSLALQRLVELAQILKVKVIDGECTNCLKDFYTKVGAKFECREERDYEFILNKFYIDVE